MRLPPPPHPRDQWRTSVFPVDGWVSVVPSRGCSSIVGWSWPKRVNPPNVIERLLGITFESKIAKAIAKSDRYCERQNAGRVKTEAALAVMR